MKITTSTAVCALLSLTTMAPAIASAQTTAAAGSDGTAVEEVVVTGSRIARRDYASDSPIVTIGDAAIAAAGSPTLESSLNTLPQVAASASSGTNTTARGGQASLDLRGLGQQRSLVLLDGRRVQPSSPDGTIDLNTIPASLIENVEIITGGASAVYGSDAVAGVVNLKLRKNVQGLELNAQYGVTGRGDGATVDFGVLAGGRFADDKGRAFLALNYSDRDRALYTERDYLRNQSMVVALNTATIGVVSSNLPSQAAVNTLFSRYGIAAGAVNRNSQFLVNTDGSLFVAAGPTNFRGSVTSPQVVYQGALQYSISELSSAQTPLTRYNMMGHVDYEVAPNVSAFLEGMFTNYTTNTGGAYANSGSSSGRPLIVPVTNPFVSPDLAALLASRPNPTAPITISAFIDDLEPRREIDEYNVYQLTGGASGKAPFAGASWNIYGTYGRTDYSATQRGYPSTVAINTLLSAPDGGRSLCAGGFNPFGFAPVSQSCVDYISRVAHNKTVLEQSMVEANLTGKLFSLPAGDLRFAAGADYRKNSYSFEPDALVATGELANYLPVSASAGSAIVKEIYGELLIPLLKDAPLAKEVSLDLSYRYSDYNTVGGVSTYKADASWEVIRGLRVRGGYSRATRAPSVGELYAAAAQGQTALGGPGVIGAGDPCDVRGAYRAAGSSTAAPVRALCLAQGVPANLVDSFVNSNPRTPFLAQGNTNLRSETADTFSLGAVVRPQFENPLISNLSASVDAYSIKLQDAIGFITNPVAAAQCFNPAVNASLSNSDYFCQLLSRDPANGQLVRILNPELNLASYSTTGVDFQADWKVALEDAGLGSDWGTVSLGVVGSYLRTFKIQNLAGAPNLDYAGTIGNAQIDVFATAHPKWKAVGTVGWSVRDLQTNLRWRYIGKMASANNVGNTGTAKGVGGVSFFDLDALWHATSKLDFRAGVVNLADKKPPTLNLSLAGQMATEPNTYDVIGRRFYVGVKARF